jgi:CRISPR-associated protein Cmr2
MSDGTKQADITKGLAQFTNKVPDIVKEHNGFLVYAGGDDVMALLPLEDALKCAAALRAHYLPCFDPNTIPTTLSGAIEYAHIKMPLGKVLHDAHDLLDNLAKDGRGRDAIACRVWKPGGLAVEWAMPWECALEDNQPGGPRIVLDRLAQDFRETAKRVAQAGSEEQGHFASKFFFRIRGLFDVLNPKNCGFFTETELLGQDASYKPVLEADKAVSLIAAEYLDSGAAKVKKLDQARDVVRPLLRQCRPVIRDKTKERPADWTRSNCLDADGALLLRFLAQKGVER